MTKPISPFHLLKDTMLLRTGALINGNADTVPTGTPQAVIDGLMKT